MIIAVRIAIVVLLNDEVARMMIRMGIAVALVIAIIVPRWARGARGPHFEPRYKRPRGESSK